MANIPTKEELEALLEYTRTSKQEQIIESVIEHGSGRKAANALGISKSTVNDTIKRIKGYAAAKGYAPENGMTNEVPESYNVKRVSTLRDGNGGIKAQWVIAEPEKDKNDSLLEAIQNTSTENIKPLEEINLSSESINPDLLTTYVSNDLHLGLLIDGKEGEKDWNLEKGLNEAKSAIDHLIKASPESKSAIVVDLGDMVEADNRDNKTKRSGNSLDVDGFHHNIFEESYKLMIYFVQRALEKHETVYFYSLPGNHDDYTAFAVHHVVKTAFSNNPRVIFSSNVCRIQYHQHGTVLLGFAHGDALKPDRAETTMVVDNQKIWSDTLHRYFHFGHVHTYKSQDKALCTVESHRHLMPLNAWAFSHGFRGPLGTMKSISYDANYGEVSRTTYNVTMGDN